MTKTKFTALYERTCRPDAESIRKQMNSLTSFAKHNGYEDIRHFTDDGYAYTDENRPGFTALMNAIQSDEVDTLVVLDCTRLTRNYTAFSGLKKELDQHGVKLVSLNLNRLPSHIHNDDNDLDYELHGDYYFPLLQAPEKAGIGKWGQMHEAWLRENHPGQYAQLLLSGKLPTMLADLDKQAKERWDILFKDICKAEGVNEELKAKDQLAWIQKTNSIIARCDEGIKSEMIFY